MPPSHGSVFHTYGTPGLLIRYFLILPQNKDQLLIRWSIKAVKGYWSLELLGGGGWQFMSNNIVSAMSLHTYCRPIVSLSWKLVLA